MEIKLCIMLEILLKNLSDEKNWEKINPFLLLSALLCEYLSKSLTNCKTEITVAPI